MSWDFWKSSNRPGLYFVTLLMEARCMVESGSFALMDPCFYAVADDFGNLVMVGRG